MKNELTGDYVAHYFQMDAHGHLGNEAILPIGGKLRGADGAVHEITFTHMPEEIVVGPGRRFVLGSHKTEKGDVVLNPVVVEALEKQEDAARAYREETIARLANQLALAS